MKTLLVWLHNEADARDALRAALPIARRHGSHLIGLHTVDTMTLYSGGGIYVTADIYASYDAAREQEAQSVKAVFEEMTGAEDFPSEWRAVKAATAEAAERLIEVAHIADLVIMARAGVGADTSYWLHVQEQVIRRSGRPVLQVPAGYAGDGFGSSALMGWSPTREAARAVHDALPLLADGAEVCVATVSSGGPSEFDGAADLASALDRHGFKAELVHRAPAHGGTAEELDVLAFERGADLIVTGAFGHSRIYDFAIGAVSLQLMRTARVPVLFSK